ncbi:DNA helicase PcrA [Heliophilum fasciatum]|uniref:ATP-dependent DNA helicase n=1 Tax=Heliophilum fasciatum TaxID=35700 RepID=A0A4R2RPU7_9FIRM|nr:DNA helicase PcrA [Heliophilum fasciatum]MCW2277973.1 DNA helicase-2/ATP-dependent DNA helicase PcrA [Heliophilum fasciatum]TCP64407.1 DNA helicase-2/ATP-dependent DNA helicase PcrA [Heliophilum fasciatum]
MGTQLLDSLNPVQREAVLHQDGPLLILAGAGSGKTRVLTHRIARLIEQAHVSPYNILAITFTNKAAKEMQERLDGIIGPAARHIWVSTFHAACVRILRRDGDKIGYGREFVIYDSDDQLRLIKDCMKELQIDEKRFAPQAVRAQISNAKNQLLDPPAYERRAYDFGEQTAAKVYHLYQRKLRANMAMDFDDLLMQTVTLFRQHADVLQYYQNKFQYIHIDEYQDTNHAQYIWVKLLAEKFRNLCVVGDDDQSVYGWRGADIQNILDFEKDYPEATTLKLEQNYRSTSHILTAANSVVRHNRGRKEKQLWTENPSGTLIRTYVGESEKDEAYYIAQRIEELVGQGRRYNDMALLYRTNAQSRALEDQLMRSGIPYRIFGGRGFYERKEIKDIIAYLRLISNPADGVSLRRIINVPKRGIGDTSVQKLFDYAASQDWTASEALRRVAEVPGLSRAVKLIQAFDRLISDLRAQAPNLLVTQIVQRMLDMTGYLRELELEKTEEAKSRIENVKEFFSVTQEFDQRSEEKTLEEFLSGVSLIADTDNYAEEDDAVVLMTMHSSKGLEFPVVFLTGMEDNLFPSSRSIHEEKLMEEERRLCYVAITRAREELYLTRALCRQIFGNTVSYRASCFFEEIPAELLEDVSPARPSRWGGSSWGQRSAYSGTAAVAAVAGSTGSFKPAEPATGVGLGSRSGSGTGIGLGTAATAKPVAIAKPAVATPGARTTGDPLLTTRQATATAEPSDGSEGYRVGDKVQHGKFGVGVVVKVNGHGDDQEINVAFTGQGIKKLLVKFAPVKKISGGQ